MESRFKTFEDVNRYLNSIPRFSHSGVAAAHFALDHMEEFCYLMGNPEKRLRAIHVAGTNGKGTTSQMLASVYQQAGYKTGLYTSPHLINYSERVRINSTPITDDQILAFFHRFEDELKQVSLTYFELGTCLAFWYFDEMKCDIVIVETGLGGRLDATNVIFPLVSIITSISMDHMSILGSTLEDIAKEKAGIIKYGVPVVTGRLPERALDVIKQEAKSKKSEVYSCFDYQPNWLNGNIQLINPNNGGSVSIYGNERKKIDCINTAMSMSAVSILKDRYPVSIAEFKDGIESLNERFPNHAHFQKLSKNYDWYFDGAHNPEAVETLLDQLSAIKGNREPIFVLSFMEDKTVPELLGNFQDYKNVYYIDTGTERCARCNKIRSLIPQARCFMYNSPGFMRILEGFKSELVIFAGSFYFYSQVNNWMASQLPSDQTIGFKIHQ